MASALESGVLAARCITVYGPSGAGKSSLVQAAVLPSLIEEHRVRVVVVEGWPEGAEPSQWLAGEMYAEIGFGEPPDDVPPREAILTAVQRLARRSERLLVIYLDQIEQLLYPGRDVDEVEAFFECVDKLVELPLGNVRVLLSLREDYLGRFRDRLRDRFRLLDRGFRVGPLTVAEITEAVCQAAAQGEPPQTWSGDELRKVMLQVRAPGEAASNQAEVVAAYAQIVCRALFQRRAGGGAPSSEDIQAEPILRGYLQTTLEALGPLRAEARALLEEHFVTKDGFRTLRVEKELLRILPAEELSPILGALEGAAILHAEEHHGTRYFELGHDWLAKMINEQREAREREAKERVRRRRAIAIISTIAAAVIGALGYWALGLLRAKEEARIAVHDANVQGGPGCSSSAVSSRWPGSC